MSSELVGGFDDLDDRPPVEEVKEEHDVWAAPSTAPERKKGKKGKKKLKKDVDFWGGWPEEEDIPFARNIEPAPLAEFEHVELGQPAPQSAPSAEEFLEAAPPPAASPLENEYPEPVPVPESVIESVPEPVTEHVEVLSKLPAASSGARPSRTAPARPLSTSFTPAPRQSTLYGSPPQQTNVFSHWGRNPLPNTPRPRTESFNARSSPGRNFVEPAAPPHMPQPHFYGLPDLGFNFGLKKEQNGGKAAGSDGYCCSFDSFADSGDAVASKRAKDALLVGSEGGLEVFRVLPNKFEVLGRLEGLRGSVVCAKILPHVDLYDALQPERPLVAVIVHGKMVEERHDSGLKDAAAKFRGVDEAQSRYQTTVEVYSLQTQQHVATLYKSVPVAIEPPTVGHFSAPPEPIGDLSVDAQGRFVVVASGKSGEVFVFSSSLTAVHAEPEFRCIGKFWTSLQSALPAPSSRPQSSSESSQLSDDVGDRAGVPIFSLGQRWLALVAPSSASHVSVQGLPLLSESSPNPPALASAVAPPQPPITSEITGVEAEDTWSRLTRQAAQGGVKYWQKGIDLGLQGWKEFTNPAPQSQHERTSSREHEAMFPPTKAPPDDPTRTAKDPAVVSIYDLQALLEVEETKTKHMPTPLTTFALTEGCNFVSFSPNGLRLLATSRKGEVSTIWDLSHSCHGDDGTLTQRDKTGEETLQGPSVRLVHRIPRSSPSVVVDCAWSQDNENLALLTTHGTVHLHEIPSRPRSRKRKRRSTISMPGPEKAQPTVSVSEDLSPPSSNAGFLGSLKFGWQSVSTQVNTIRSQNPVSGFGIPTTFAGFKEATANAGSAGGRVIARGLSQGINAAKGGASDYWHSEDNKIRNKALDHVGPRSIKWIKRQSDLLLAIVCGGTVYLHPVQRIERKKGDEGMISWLKHDKYGRKDFALPPIRTRASSDASNGLQQGRKAKEDESCAQEGPHGFWILRPVSSSANEIGRRTSGQAKSQVNNEVETNPPYCPFHVDARVDIFAFEDDVTAGSQMDFMDSQERHVFHLHGYGLAEDAEPNWIFGEALPASTKMNTHEYLDDFHGDYSADSDQELAEQVESRLTIRTATEEDGREEIRINTRRTRGGGGDGEFEVLDDDEGGGSVYEE